MKETGTALLLLSLLALSACQGNSIPSEVRGLETQTGIVGGKTTREIADPAYWSVAALELEISVSSIQGSQKESALCTGTLIEKNVILTAAHCLLPKEKIPFASVTISGFAFFSQTGERYSIRQAIGHREYNENVQRDATGTVLASPVADIAVLLLEQEVSTPLRPALLPTNAVEENALLKTRIYGYGAENYLNKFFSTQASDTDVEEDSSPMPLRWVDTEGRVLGQQLRYDQSLGKGICKGDSGGPHFIYKNKEPIVIAVSSSLTNVSLNTPDWCRKESLAILVEPYLPWIQENIAKLRSNSK